MVESTMHHQGKRTIRFLEFVARDILDRRITIGRLPMYERKGFGKNLFSRVLRVNKKNDKLTHPKNRTPNLRKPKTTKEEAD